MSTTQTIAVCLICAFVADYANAIGGIPYWAASVAAIISLAAAGYAFRRYLKGRP